MTYIAHRGLHVPPGFIVVQSGSYRQSYHLAGIPDAIAVRSGPVGVKYPCFDCVQRAFIIRGQFREQALSIRGVKEIKRPRHLLFYGGMAASDGGSRKRAAAMGVVERSNTPDSFAGDSLRLVNRESGSGDQTPPAS